MAIWEPGISRPIARNWNPKSDPVEAAADILGDVGFMKGSDIYQSVVNAEGDQQKQLRRFAEL